MQELEEEHFSGKVAQKAIIIQGGKILIARDVNDEATWEIPGGRLNVDEDPKAGLARELFEELGVHCEIGTVVYVEQFFHTREENNTLLIAYLAELKNPGEKFKLAPDEVAEVKWVTQEELTEVHVFDNCQRAIEAYFASEST